MKRLTDVTESPSENFPSGAATLDYILVLGIILPLVAFVVPAGRRMISLVFEMLSVMISWPFM